MKRILAMILCVLTFVAVFAGCGGESGVSKIVVSEFVFNTEDFKGQKLTWWSHWDETDANGDQARFMEATGATYEYGNIGGGGVNAAYYSKLANALAAGTGPDIACVYGWAMPSWIRKELLVPMDQVLDLEDPFWDQFGGWEKVFNKNMLEHFSYEGKKYVWVDRKVNAYYCIYRKDMFEEAGLDDPYELYKKGEWNWDVFNEMMEALTYDSDDDEIIDKFGITGYLSEAFFGTIENGDYIRWRDDGTPYFAFTDPDMIACLEQERLVVNNGWYDNSHGSPINTFCSGNVAMLVSANWDWQKAFETFGVENIGWVQMPIAPTNKSGVVLNHVNAGGYAATNNLDCAGLAEHYLQYKYHTAWFTEYPEDVQKAWDEKQLAYFGCQELMDFDDEMTDLSFSTSASGWGGLYDVCTQKVLWNYNGGSIEQQVQSIAVAAQTIIDDVFYGEE